MQTAEHDLNHRHSLSTKMWRDATITHKNLIQNYSKRKQTRTSQHTQPEPEHLAFMHFNNNVSDLMPRCTEQSPG